MGIRPKLSAQAKHCGTTVLDYAAKRLSMDGMVVWRNRGWVRTVGAGPYGVARQTVVDRRAVGYRGWIWVLELDGISCEESKTVTTSR